jgi:hypothetical protein
VWLAGAVCIFASLRGRVNKREFEDISLQISRFGTQVINLQWVAMRFTPLRIEQIFRNPDNNLDHLGFLRLPQKMDG